VTRPGRCLIRLEFVRFTEQAAVGSAFATPVTEQIPLQIFCLSSSSPFVTDTVFS